jgi:hypothetical protein
MKISNGNKNTKIAMKILNGHGKQQNVPSQGLPKYTIVGIFGKKTVWQPCI